jgi:hypothetical protein
VEDRVGVQLYSTSDFGSRLSGLCGAYGGDSGRHA